MLSKKKKKSLAVHPFFFFFLFPPQNTFLSTTPPTPPHTHPRPLPPYWPAHPTGPATKPWIEKLWSIIHTDHDPGEDTQSPSAGSPAHWWLLICYSVFCKHVSFFFFYNRADIIVHVRTDVTGRLVFNFPILWDKTMMSSGKCTENKTKTKCGNEP